MHIIMHGSPTLLVVQNTECDNFLINMSVLYTFNYNTSGHVNWKIIRFCIGTTSKGVGLIA